MKMMNCFKIAHSKEERGELAEKTFSVARLFKTVPRYPHEKRRLSFCPKYSMAQMCLWNGRRLLATLLANMTAKAAESSLSEHEHECSCHINLTLGAGTLSQDMRAVKYCTWEAQEWPLGSQTDGRAIPRVWRGMTRRRDQNMGFQKFDAWERLPRKKWGWLFYEVSIYSLVGWLITRLRPCFTAYVITLLFSGIATIAG